MQKIIGVTEFRRNFRSFFDEVVRKRVPLVLARGSRPEAVLIPYEDYLRFQQMQESEVLARFDRVWSRLAEVNAAYSEDEIAADIQAARSAVKPSGKYVMRVVVDTGELVSAASPTCFRRRISRLWPGRIYWKVGDK